MNSKNIENIYSRKWFRLRELGKNYDEFHARGLIHLAKALENEILNLAFELERLGRKLKILEELALQEDQTRNNCKKTKKDF